MSRLRRLSARAYGRLTPEQKHAVDLLEWQRPGPAERGEAKTVLGWRRTREETIAYAHELLGRGLMAGAVADRLGVSDDYLRRALDPGAGRSDSTYGLRGGQALAERVKWDARRLMEEYPHLFVDVINAIEADAEQYFTIEDVQKPPRNRSRGAEKSGTTDNGKGIRCP